MYPYALNPVYSQAFKIGDHEVEVPKCVLRFQYWEGKRFKDTFGGRIMIAVDGEPVFPEVNLLNQFMADGWQSRWLVTYGRAKSTPLYLSGWQDDTLANQQPEPIEEENIAKLMAAIAKANGGSYMGCWDTLHWKDDEVIFAQSKRNNKDKITPANVNWLKAALSVGLTPDNFLIVQWDFHPRSA
ncbi:MAG: hypothetical protein KA149_05725 [Chitinophagales bacterium]|nr:hypothetical protein [Chitinophagales bacterium]